MGSSYSFIESEKLSWEVNLLEYDENVRSCNLKSLHEIKNGEDIFISYTWCCWGNITFQHWFVTDDKYFIEFGAAYSDIYNARVTINNCTRNFEKTNSTKMSEDVRNRILRVLGMSNYSLVFRNSEHVANYIIKDRWYSAQLDEDTGELYKLFRKYLSPNNKKIVNAFPSNIKPHSFKDYKKNIYSFSTNYIKATRFDYYLDSAEDTYNILMIGPTGAGKSHLINIMFNQPICNSKESMQSVTRETYFIRGQGVVYDEKINRFVTKDIVVADTVGLCDCEWSNAQVINMIKNRICANCVYLDAVFIVFRGDDRLKGECIKNIKKILEWLKYYTTKSSRFIFVGTHCDHIEEEKKKELANEFKYIFGINENTIRALNEVQFDRILFTGFPSENRIKLEPSLQEVVDKSLKNFELAIKYPGTGERIKTKKKSCIIL